MAGRDDFIVLGTVSLPGVCSSVGQARRYVRETFEHGHPRLDDLELAVSELVTNAVLYSDSAIDGDVELRLAARDKTVRVEVADEGAEYTRPHLRDGDPGGGHGLKIVGTLGRWGVLDRPDGRTTWCEIDE